MTFKFTPLVNNQVRITHGNQHIIVGADELCGFSAELVEVPKQGRFRPKKWEIVISPDYKAQSREITLGPYTKHFAKRRLRKITKDLESYAKSSLGRGFRLRWAAGFAALALAGYALMGPGMVDSDQQMDFPIMDPDQLVEITPTMLSNIGIVAKEVGIPVVTGRDLDKATTPFFVFSSPDCKSCDSLNIALADVPEKYLPILMPANFEHDVDSAFLVAASYCSDTPDQTWIDIAKGGPAPDPSLLQDCDWQDKARSSSLIAQLIGVAKNQDDWPLVVTASGKVSLGSYPEDALPTLIHLLETQSGAQ